MIDEELHSQELSTCARTWRGLAEIDARASERTARCYADFDVAQRERALAPLEHSDVRRSARPRDARFATVRDNARMRVWRADARALDEKFGPF